MTARPIPDVLSGVSFRASESAGLGVVPRSRSSRVSRPFHGVRSIDLDQTPVARCRSFEPLLRRGQFFSHTTALALWSGVVVDDVLHVSVEFPRTPPRGRGVVGHALRRADCTVREGLPIASPAAAWRQSAAVLSEEDLVIAGDALLGGARMHGTWSRPPCTHEELVDEHARSPRSRGAVRARTALARVRAGVGSPQESRLRLAIVDAGLPEPVVDHPVAIAAGRVWHPDLAYPAQRIAIEYEGDEHRRDRTRWRRDIARREAFEDIGWRVVRVVADDLRERRELIRRVGGLLAIRAESQPASGIRAEWHE